MWLLNTQSLKLEFFHSEVDAPKYAILSHTWEEEEVTFQEIGTPGAANRKGYPKIQNTCSQAVRNSYQYVWIDTCCIDKKSSAELSEAINSMFRYYSKADICYVYLSDLDLNERRRRPEKITFKDGKALDDARWFRRGWTLQELLAPSALEFYDRVWNYLGRLECDSHLLENGGLSDMISRITGISTAVLTKNEQLASLSVAERMSWAALRSTTRLEDRAYSLMGIFDINMPLLYGEGSKAFQRLQEEIIRQSSVVDHSILAWIPWSDDSGPRDFDSVLEEDIATIGPNGFTQQLYPGVLSPSPYGFRYSGNIVSWDAASTEEFQVVQRGIRLIVHVEPLYETNLWKAKQYSATINCKYKDTTQTALTIKLNHIPYIDPEFAPSRIIGSDRLLLTERVNSRGLDAGKAFTTTGPDITPGYQREIVISKVPFIRPEAIGIIIAVELGGDTHLWLRHLVENGHTEHGPDPIEDYFNNGFNLSAKIYGKGSFLIKCIQGNVSTFAVLLLRVDEVDGELGTRLYASIHSAEMHLPSNDIEEAQTSCVLCRELLSATHATDSHHTGAHAWWELSPDQAKVLEVWEQPPAFMGSVRISDPKSAQHSLYLKLEIRTRYIRRNDEVWWTLVVKQKPPREEWSLFSQ